MPPVPQVLALAHQHHQAGDLQEAERLYALILHEHPAHPEVLRLLGVIAHQRGQHARAIELIRQALAAEPNNSEGYCSASPSGRLGYRV